MNGNDFKRTCTCIIGFMAIYKAAMPVDLKGLFFMVLGGALLMASGIVFPPKDNEE